VTRYEDDAVALNDHGIAIENNGRPRKERRIEYTEIRDAQLVELGFGTGKYRLVGISPGRPRTFFHCKRGRSHDRVAISLDTGRRLHRAISPDDPEQVLAIIEAELAAPNRQCLP